MQRWSGLGWRGGPRTYPQPPFLPAGSGPATPPVPAASCHDAESAGAEARGGYKPPRGWRAGTDAQPTHLHPADAAPSIPGVLGQGVERVCTWGVPDRVSPLREVFGDIQSRSARPLLLGSNPSWDGVDLPGLGLGWEFGGQGWGLGFKGWGSGLPDDCGARSYSQGLGCIWLTLQDRRTDCGVQVPQPLSSPRGAAGAPRTPPPFTDYTNAG